ncbi:MAG: ATP-binding cassette domain-containing protein [Candidatus Latescibacterota bacterium]|jgi:osmoprotectant transport system ATP-binding protein
MPQIVMEDVSKSYGAETALSGVSLQFEDGVTTAVVGRSGGGKSTLLRSINGLVRPDRGGVRVLGEPIDYRALPQLRRRIGYAVQGTGLFPHMTVRGNITLLARLEGWPQTRADDRCDRLMELVELPREYSDRYPHELSGGQQQRVGLCRAMVLDPPLFLLDEPFAALDPITKGEIHGEFTRLQQASARTIVLVTHDLREAVKLAQRLVILEKGRVVQHGPVPEVLDRPADDTVRSLLAAQLDEGKGRM